MPVVVAFLVFRETEREMAVCIAKKVDEEGFDNVLEMAITNVGEATEARGIGSAEAGGGVGRGESRVVFEDLEEGWVGEDGSGGDWRG